MSNLHKYEYVLPDKDNRPVTRTTSINSLIIIGANGSGKSQLGAWMEKQDPEGTHRVGAQRNLNFSEHIPLKSYEDAESEWFYGGNNKDCWNEKKNLRWNWGKEYTTKLLDDFDPALSTLVAQYNLEVQNFFEQCRVAEEHYQAKPDTPPTVLDKLLNVWNTVFPQRKLKYSDTKFIAALPQDDEAVEYPASQMSDGERSVLYLAAQVLCVPDGKKIVVDEPEIHLHPSLMGRLWQVLEAERPECFFVFITHDVQFASLHSRSDKVWTKSFDGTKWDWTYLPTSDLPEPLLIELLGNRKNVLFVEGEKDSYDVQLYSMLYPDYYVVPSGGCTQVIVNTKAFASTSELHKVRAFGIIDRDYREDSEISALQKKGVYCLEVAEIENLFIVEPVLYIMARQFGCSNEEEVVQKIEDYVIDERFSKELGKQIRKSTIFSLKERLTAIEITGSDEKEIASCFGKAINNLDTNSEYCKQEQRFRKVLEMSDYRQVLKLFNEKSVSKSVGQFFGIDNKEYCQKVVELMMGDKREELVRAMSEYTPQLPS